MRTNAKRQTVIEAMNTVNKKYGYSLSLKRDEQIGNWFYFTLTTPSKVPGARVSWSGRNLAAASYHAHGYLFDEIFKLDPKCKIWSMQKAITINGGNWEDSNIGSSISPIPFSQTSIL